MTNPDRWQRIEAIYQAALARDEADRARYIAEACGDDAALRREVESLIRYTGLAPEFMRTTAMDALTGGDFNAGGAAAAIGSRIGPYEIVSLIGSGGMGDVYRAHDPKLGRDVAIKILPKAFMLDAERRERFEREARLLASLNHPNVAAIYGFEHQGDVHALVLEFVSGQTLRERLRGGPLPIDEALKIARQLANALEAAHARGIVHRDLKPANIGLTADGNVKVLDFGLAKAVGDRAGAHEETIEGIVLGTAAYMSPEQARGKTVDHRTDIWSFGCVLWETLTGQRTFGGATASDSIAAILASEPAWNLLPAATPPGVVRLLRRCLEKDPARRLHHIADARIEIDDDVASRQASGQSTRSSTRLLVAAAAFVALVAIVAAIAIRFRVAPAPVGPTRLSVSTPGMISPQLSAAISPDGRRLAFVSTGGTGKLMLWVRALDSLDARVLPGTEDAAHPFWSPDGRFLGFLANGKVKKIEAAGGPVETLADTAERSAPSWSSKGSIVFVSKAGELGAISADGGPITPVVPRDPSGRRVVWPFFLPDGRHFLFLAQNARAEERGLYVGSLDGETPRFLVRTEFKGAYSAGYLLFVRDEALIAQPFDVDRLELHGQPALVADGVWVAPGAGQASFSVSGNGVIAHVNATLWNLQLSWFDRTGQRAGTVGEPTRYSGSPQLSPDGNRVAIAQGPLTSEHVWLLNSANPTRLTFGSSRETAPVWSGDGRRIAFQSSTGRGTALAVKAADGSGSDEVLLEASGIVSLADWSPDDKFLVYTTPGQNSLSDLWLLPLAGSHQAIPFLQTAFNKTQPQVSPDGRWIAYTSYESGRDEVYVESFPAPGNKRQISAAGGVQPRWRADGKELFYLGVDQQMMAVPIRSAATLEAGAPAALFKTRLLPQGSQSIGLATLYDVAPDGQRFLFVTPPDEQGPPITVILDWTAALK